MPIAGLVTMLFPSLRMHVGHLLHERLKLAIVLRPDHKMPMIGEQAVGAESHRAGAKRLLDDPLERQEILVLVKQRPAAHASIQHMENHSARGIA